MTDLEKELRLAMIEDAKVFALCSAGKIGLAAEKEKTVRPRHSETMINRVRSLRKIAWGYKAIGTRLRLSERVVSEICKRNGIS